MVDVGLGHLAQELPGEARQAFDIPPLPFGIQRVERQRALARSADAGQANQLVPRQDEIDVPQVVLAGTLDDDIRSGHARPGRVSECTSDPSPARPGLYCRSCPPGQTRGP